MESIHKLENMMGEWLKPLPHLPVEWRNWISKNVWWITLVGVVISVFGILGLFSALSFFTATTNHYGPLYTAATQTHGGLWKLSIYISLALLVATVVVEAMAISPLKVMSKKGWDLLFLAYLLSVVSGVIGAVLNVDIFSLITTAIGAAIGAYFLFEIRSHFKKA